MQIKSKEHVKEFGEVYTNKKEIDAMLDLLSEESYKINSKFLEPSCGDGNFLVSILQRKLSRVNELYSNDFNLWKHYCFVAVASIYAIDILKDNVEESKRRLRDVVFLEHSKISKQDPSKFLEVIDYVLNSNIMHGDFITMCTVGDNPKYLTFSDWFSDETGKIVRRDYNYVQIKPKKKKEQPTVETRLIKEYMPVYYFNVNNGR